MMPYVVYTASLVIGASAWMLSQAVDDADFEELQDSYAVPDPE
jgi:hypothetical protein